MSALVQVASLFKGMIGYGTCSYVGARWLPMYINMYVMCFRFPYVFRSNYAEYKIKLFDKRIDISGA
jgi:hypothetical protein